MVHDACPFFQFSIASISTARLDFHSNLVRNSNSTPTGYSEHETASTAMANAIQLKRNLERWHRKRVANFPSFPISSFCSQVSTAFVETRCNAHGQSSLSLYEPVPHALVVAGRRSNGRPTSHSPRSNQHQRILQAQQSIGRGVRLTRNPQTRTGRARRGRNRNRIDG